MTTPNVTTELYLPKTYIFERKDKSFGDEAFMTRQGQTLDYVYLPKGLSAVTVTATAFNYGRVKVVLTGRGYQKDLTDYVSVEPTTARLWTGQISNSGSGNEGLWLKVQAKNITTGGMNSGSVSVQIVNFPPET